MRILIRGDPRGYAGENCGRAEISERDWLMPRRSWANNLDSSEDISDSSMSYDKWRTESIPSTRRLLMLTT